MKRKIIGATVGSPLPKPNLMQTDPAKGDYVKGKEEFLEQIATPDPGGNTGTLYVSATSTDGVNYTVDKTSSEIIEAATLGKTVILKYGVDDASYLFQLTGVDDNGALFSGIVKMAEDNHTFVQIVIINSRVEVVFEDIGGESESESESSLFLVKFTINNDGSYSADKTRMDVIMAHLAGKIVYGVMQVEWMPDVYIPLRATPAMMAIFDDTFNGKHIRIDYTYNDAGPVDNIINVEITELSGGNAKNGIPAGGKTGQYLCKQSDEDYDVVWADLIIPEQYGLVTYDQDKTITIT